MEVQDTWPSVRRKEIESMGLKDLYLIDPLFFNLDTFWKIRRHHWTEHLKKLVNLPSLNVICLKRAKVWLRKIGKNYHTFVWWWQVCAIFQPKNCVICKDPRQNQTHLRNSE